MKYRITVKKKALKQVNEIPLPMRQRIFAGIRKLEDSETWGDVRKLVNHKYDYRLRIGNYRVLFDTANDMTLEINDISVEEVKKRDDRTY